MNFKKTIQNVTFDSIEIKFSACLIGILFIDFLAVRNKVGLTDKRIIQKWRLEWWNNDKKIDVSLFLVISSMCS